MSIFDRLFKKNSDGEKEQTSFSGIKKSLIEWGARGDQEELPMDLENKIGKFVRLEIDKNKNGSAETIVRSLPQVIQVIFVIKKLMQEVNNGGFDQYFENSSGELSNLCLEKLELIGANEHADLLRKAIEITNTRDPKRERYVDHKKVGEVFAYEDRFEGFDGLNEKFCRTIDEKIYEIRDKFIRSNLNHL